MMMQCLEKLEHRKKGDKRNRLKRRKQERKIKKPDAEKKRKVECGKEGIRSGHTRKVRRKRRNKVKSHYRKVEDKGVEGDGTGLVIVRVHIYILHH